MVVERKKTHMHACVRAHTHTEWVPYSSLYSSCLYIIHVQVYPIPAYPTSWYSSSSNLLRITWGGDTPCCVETKHHHVYTKQLTPSLFSRWTQLQENPWIENKKAIFVMSLRVPIGIHSSYWYNQILTLGFSNSVKPPHLSQFIPGRGGGD